MRGPDAFAGGNAVWPLPTLGEVGGLGDETSVDAGPTAGLTTLPTSVLPCESEANVLLPGVSEPSPPPRRMPCCFNSSAAVCVYCWPMVLVCEEDTKNMNIKATKAAMMYRRYLVEPAMVPDSGRSCVG